MSRKKPRKADRRFPVNPTSPLRIIGGRLRGRSILYLGDPRTRPMKDRVREAVFNLLGPAVRETHAVDLFAGTGALALEAISRGARRATCIERHFPSARLILRNAQQLHVEERVIVLAADTFVWAQKQHGLEELATDLPWVVFCSPPYAFYQERLQDMLELLGAVLEQAPASSCIIVESDKHFDTTEHLPQHGWDVRQYSPARIAIAET